VSQSSTIEPGATAPPDNTMALQDNQQTQSMLAVDTSCQIPQSDSTSPHHVDETSRVTHQIDAKPPSDPSIYLPGARTTFMSLPLEIRVMVYELSLNGDFMVEVTSLKKWNSKKITTKISHNSITTALLPVNKQIHAEAAPVFYKTNIFLIGNGDWGTRRQANLHGLQSFISRVPAWHLSLITTLAVDFYTFPHQWASSTDRDPWRKSPKEFQSLVRALMKYFQGVTQLEIHIRWDHRRTGNNYVPFVADSNNMASLCDGLRTLVRHEKLRGIWIYEDNFGSLKPMLSLLKAANPLVRSVLEMQY
jgi:hypothetical protein